jgi:hypothetical protein
VDRRWIGGGPLLFVGEAIAEQAVTELVDAAGAAQDTALVGVDQAPGEPTGPAPAVCRIDAQLAITARLDHLSARSRPSLCRNQASSNAAGVAATSVIRNQARGSVNKSAPHHDGLPLPAPTPPVRLTDRR